MKIIREGNLNKTTKIYKYRLKCRRCGCIFECDANEVSIISGRYNELHARHECPTCKEPVYADN